MTDNDRSTSRPIIVRAKNVDRAPDITSDEYWDAHDIALVRMTEVPPTEAGGPAIMHQVVQRISEGPIEPRGAIERHQPLAPGNASERRPLGAAPPEIPPTPGAGDEFVVFSPRHASGTVAAVPVDGSPERVAFINRLNRIARLRGEGGGDALKQAALDPDRDVALYSLKRLLKQETRNLDGAFVARLRTLAATPEADPELRLFAERVTLRTTKGAVAEKELVWLESALTDARGYDWTRLRVLALGMLEFPETRERAARFLTSLVNDSTQPLEARIAAYSVFEDDRLFPQDRTDAVADLVFETAEQMARSPEELIRRAGTMLLHNLTARVTPPQRPAYAERARNLLRSTLTEEKNPASAHLIQRSLDLLHPPEEKR